MRLLLRALRHAWFDTSDSWRALPHDAAERLAQRVAQSEQRHSGEIRICIEAGVPLAWWWSARGAVDARPLWRRRARDWFGRLGVWDTEHNSGVLVYLLLAERTIEIVADRGVAARVDAREWQHQVEVLASACRGGDLEAGLTQVVQALDALLTQHFPVAPGTRNPNELPDAVVRV